MPAIVSTTLPVADVARLRLVPALPEHAALWHRWRNEASTQRHNPVDPLSLEELARRLAGTSADLREETFTDFRWMVELDETTLIATVAIKDVSWRMRFGELAWGVGEQWQGQGWGTASAWLLVDHIFRTSRLERVFAAIHDENRASRRVAEKIGMTYEGTLRSHFIIQGQRVNECVYGLLRDEWAALTAPGSSAGPGSR